MEITLKEVIDDTGTTFFFHGIHPNGKDFCGTADDMATALDMAKESVETEWK